MNILFLSQIVPYPPHGGVLQRGFNIIQQVSKRNRVHLLAFVDPGILSSEKLVDESRMKLSEYCSTVEYFSLWPKRSDIHKYGAFLLGAFYSRPFSVLAHHSPALTRKMKEIVENEDIDLIHFDTIGLARFHKEYNDIPSVLTHHNIESQLMERRAKYEKNLFARKYVSWQAGRLKRYESQQSPLFDANVVMSEADRDSLRDIAPMARSEIVPNGVDTDYFQDSGCGSEQALVFTGGMNMFANADAMTFFLSDVWPEIKKAFPKTRFYLIGQDPPREICRMSEVDPQIIVTGFVDDVRPFVRKSAVYVVPIRVGGGTRLKVLDAMAQGKAVVSTSIGSEGISVSDGKNVLIADTREELAASVIDLLRDEKKRERLGSEARQFVVENYSWTEIGNTLQDVYEDVAKR